MGTDGTWPLFISTFLCRGNWFKSIFSILLPSDTIRQRGSEQNTTVHIFLFLSFHSFVYIIYLFFLHSLAFIFFSPLCCYSLSLRGIAPEWNCFSIQGVFVSLPNDCRLSSNEIWELEWLVYLHKSSSVLSRLITRVSGDHLWRDLTSLLTGTNITMFFHQVGKNVKWNICWVYKNLSETVFYKISLNCLILWGSLGIFLMCDNATVTLWQTDTFNKERNNIMCCI